MIISDCRVSRHSVFNICLVWNFFVFQNSTQNYTCWCGLSSFGSVNMLVAIDNERALSFDWNNTHSSWFHKTTRVLMSLSIMRSKRKKVHFKQINRNKRCIHARKTVKSEKEPRMNLFNALKPLDVPTELCCDWLVPNINNIWLHPNMAKKISLQTRKHLWKFELRKSENLSG